jgi:PDZ domain
MKLLPKLRSSLATTWLLAVLVASGSARADDAAVDQWIAQLDSNQYQVREEATRRLLDAGTAALDALTSAANGDRPEPADRAVWVLQRLADSENLEQRQTVLEHLIQIKNRPQVAANAQAALAEIKNDIAAHAIQELGGRILEQQFDLRWPQETHQLVILDDNWRGGDAGLKHLAGLRDLGSVTIIRTDVTREGLDQLSGIGSLQSLQLYGTQLDDSDKTALAQAMPSVEIDYRRGALLGIKGVEAGPAQVQSVQPGSAAAAADLRKGDIIQNFNGKPVADFKELTGEIAACRAGEAATLKIQRDGHTMEIKVTLGRWETL